VSLFDTISLSLPGSCWTEVILEPILTNGGLSLALVSMSFNLQ